VGTPLGAAAMDGRQQASAVGPCRTFKDDIGARRCYCRRTDRRGAQRKYS